MVIGFNVSVTLKLLNRRSVAIGTATASSGARTTLLGAAPKGVVDLGGLRLAAAVGSRHNETPAASADVGCQERVNAGANVVDEIIIGRRNGLFATFDVDGVLGHGIFRVVIGEPLNVVFSSRTIFDQVLAASLNESAVAKSRTVQLDGIRNLAVIGIAGSAAARRAGRS
jgi:hypothetical protein